MSRTRNTHNHPAHNRRDFLRLSLQGGLAASLGSALGCKRSSSDKNEAVRRGDGPRYYVGLLLSGGHDTIYTTDPKERAEVLEDVFLPEDNTIASYQDMRFGSHFAPLHPMAQDLAIVNGVQLGTANHDTGILQFFKLKTNPAANMPSALDIVSLERDNQPLGAVYLNVVLRMSHTPMYIGTTDRFYHGERNIIDEVAATNPDELRVLGKSLLAKAQSLRREGQRSNTSITLSNMEQAGRFFTRVADVEPLVKQTHSSNYMVQMMGEGFDQALWLLQNDLACSVGVDLGLLEWDSHIANHPRQTLANTNFVKHFTRFMKALSETSNKHGSLADNTVVFAGSDMGRFPRLNDMRGKDHLPQTSFLLAGKGLNTGGSFGRTGKQMEALPVSLTTGAHDPVAGKKLLLDDIGATVLTLAGLDPELYGNYGHVLDFLLRKRAS
jgi:hypothetical protein